jgi:acylphosphatase
MVAPGGFLFNISLKNRVAFQAIVHGRVQGVCYRAFVYQKAVELAINGFARNLSSGNAVEVQAEGEKESLEKLIEYLKAGPQGAWVKDVTVSWSTNSTQFEFFEIRD